MKFWKRTTLFAVIFTLLLTLFGTLSAQADGFFYRFTTPLPAVHCGLVRGPNPAALETNGITVEWNLPDGASLDVHATVNAVTSFLGNFPLASGAGSQLFAGLSQFEPAFPITVGLTYDTIIGGQVVYTSTIAFSCQGVGTGTSTIQNGTVGGASGGTCLAIPTGSVVGDMPLGAQAFYAPGKATNITLNPGTYWVLGQDESGKYYKILLACQYLWVQVDTMQPSFQAPWSGQALPTQVVS